MRLMGYIVKRLLLLIPVLIGVSIIIFTLTRMTGDPAAAYINDKMSQSQIDQIYEKYHFDEPVINQYWYWVQGIVQGDWGWSKTAVQPVTTAIRDRVPVTMELTIMSILIGVTIGVTLGTMTALRKDKVFDHTTRIVSLIGVSIPVFWLALILQYVFFYELRLFPAGGLYSIAFIGKIPHITGFIMIDSLLVGNIPLFINHLKHMLLPAITLSFGVIAILIRIQRNSMLEVLNLDYVKTARAKGLPEKKVINKHARRNALIPTTTVIGLSFGGSLGGAVLTESIFALPGLGRWSADSITRFDSTSVLGFVLFIAIVYVLVNLAVDVLYAYLDPRVRLE
ncbi:MAG: dipeptide transporter permease DppB [Methanomassiliicoccales archaeon PtaB.Bin134]|nr:MAG: dipeptide transporter permease DppB [Methanomassiliicoccales archaeon PtaB.Bin134]